jgi:glycosyltransferase involved in cell wall biosynthesis
MDICMLSELFYPFMLGGAERRYYELAKRLAKKHNVTVYALNLRGSESREMKDGIEIIRVGNKHPLDRRSLPALASFLPSVLRPFSSGYDIIDANQGMGSFSGFIKPLVKKPVVATFHDIYWNQWGDYLGFPASSIGKTMEFLWSKERYSRIITVSPTTEKKLRRLGFGSPISVIPSGVESGLIDGVKAKRSRHRVAYVGRLVKYKNIDKLMIAFQKVQKTFNDAELAIVGVGPEETALRDLSAKLKINAKFYGFVTENEKFRIIKSADVLVNPSDVEGLGLILIEAMACGTPVVAKNLETYFFCNTSNSALYENDGILGDVIIKILENTKLANKLAKNGLATAEKFSWDNVAKEVEAVYEELL